MKKLAALIALGLTGAALAQPPPSPSTARAPAAERQPPAADVQRFESLDRNGDGVLDRQEAHVVRGLKFSAADTDGNSTIDPREYSIAVAKIVEGSRAQNPLR